jgi:putative phosphotransacetylase
VEESKLLELITKEIIGHLHSRPVSGGQSTAKLLPVAVSVRHLHLAQREIDILFGENYQLTKQRDLYQPGEFAAEEIVTLVGPKLKSISNVRVLGPVRSRTQVEISRTDAITLGIDAPVRPSGKLDGSAAITLVGPIGSITLKDSCIVANRHIHINRLEAVRWGLKDNGRVEVRVSGDKPTILGDVQIRVGENFKLVMHIDTDDANAVDIRCGAAVEIVAKEPTRCS